MNRATRVLLVMLLPILVVTGCGPKSSSSAAGSASSGASATALPADPSQSASDAAPIDTSCPTSNTKSFAKTKFVLHSGLAFGAFHRYLWKPYKANTFQKGSKGRIGAFVKGGLAALFIKREVRLASEDVKANPTLCKAIAAPLGQIGNSVQSAFDKLKGGDASGLTNVNNSISSVEGSSSKDGAPITEDENANLTSTPQ
jgi:hypothetical protein